MIKKFLKTSGSLKFAVALLSVLIIASIAGTIYETKFNADVAQKYIYGAPWFNIWLTLLGINLFAAAAVRYPWKPHQTGFVITHAGIITLLIGAMGGSPLRRGRLRAPVFDPSAHERHGAAPADFQERISTGRAPRRALQSQHAVERDAASMRPVTG